MRMIRFRAWDGFEKAFISDPIIWNGQTFLYPRDFEMVAVMK